MQIVPAEELLVTNPLESFTDEEQVTAITESQYNEMLVIAL